MPIHLSRKKLKMLCSEKMRLPSESRAQCMKNLRHHAKPEGERKIKTCSAKDPAIRKVIRIAQNIRQGINSGRITDAGGAADSASYYVDDMLRALKKRCGRKSKGLIKKIYR